MSSVDLPKNKPLKCVLVGPSGSGKTSFLTQLVHQTFDPQYIATICTNFSKYKHTNNYYFDLWEVSGESPGHLLPMYIRRANFILLFVNPTSNGANDWRVDFGQFFKTFSPRVSDLFHNADLNNTPRVAFVCTHSDQPYVNISDLTEFQTQLSETLKQPIPIFHVSCVDGLGINETISSQFDSPNSSVVDDNIMDSHVEVDNEEKEDKNEGKFCTIL
jgi:GTPase SAR1 family protein